MTITAFDKLTCPLDGTALQQAGVAWQCASGHSYDIARQSYVHLLPVQNKRSRDPGDSKAMVAARRAFLNSGYYQPIADAVAEAVLSGAPLSQPLACLDAGCGEGYYLRRLAEVAGGHHPLSILGLDISKYAIQAAARQDARPAWVVGSNANLPVEAESMDRLLCLFGFPVYAEFARVLKPGGRLVQVDAGPDHLKELRAIIYPEVRKETRPEKALPEGFERLSSRELSLTLELTNAGAIGDLLAMTPHFYRANAEGRAAAEALESLSVTVQVRIHSFEKTRA